jgi:four helix bundle protein
MATIKRFEDLECWKKAREFCKSIYAICAETPLAKDFSLKDQIERSSG